MRFLTKAGAAFKRILTRNAIIGVALAATLPVAGLSSANAQTYTMTEAGFRVLYMAPVFVAIDKGFFAAHGLTLNFKEISSGALGAAAVLSGDVQISDDDPKAAGQLKLQGKSPLMIYNLVNRVTLDLIVRKEVLAKMGVTPQSPLMDRAKALKGLTFGITAPGAPTDYYARYFLAIAGLNPDRDATLVQVGGLAALDAAFRSGRIDAFLLSPPLPQTLEGAGLGTILIHNTAGEVADLTDTNYTSLFTTADYAAKNPGAIAAYTAGVRDGVKWLNDNRDQAVDYLAQKWFADSDKAALKTSLGVLLPALSTTGHFDPDAVAKYLKVFEILGDKLPIDTKEGGIWTNKFVQ